MIAGFVRGLSVRDVENTLADALGAEAALSKSAVSRICQAIGDEFDGLGDPPAGRPGAGLPVPGRSISRCTPARGPSRCWPRGASPPTASRCSSALAAGGSESADAWGGFLAELGSAGCACRCWSSPTARAGLIGAVERTGPALRQRCLIHRARNVLAKVPAAAQAEIQAAYWAIFDTVASTRRTRARTARRRRAGPHRRVRRDATASSYPSAVSACSPTGSSSPATCASPREHCTSGSGTPTSSSAPSARPAAGSRSSAGCPARPAACQPRLGRPGPRQPRLARRSPDHCRAAAAARPAPPAPRPAHPNPPAPADRR